VQIDFLGIQAFLAVAECGSFGLAAERLHLSQTAISHRMRKMEESLGVQLIVRTSRGIALTQAGDALLPRARTALQELEDSCDEVRKHGQNATQWVSFGCLPTLAISLLVPLLEEAQRAWPGLPVRAFDASPVEIVELVQARTASFGLTLLQPAPEGLSVQPLAQEPFVLACPERHPLAQRPSVAWAELQDEPLVRISLRSGNSMTIDASLGALRERLRWRYEVQRTAMAIELVRAGLGLTFVPRLSVQAGDGLAVVALQEPVVHRTLALLTRFGESLGPQERFLAGAAADLIRARLAG
jgi:DNA-binding transcriptional LysR family regulator